MSTEIDLERAMARACAIAREVGEYQLSGLGKHKVEFKGRVELVTEVDRESERRVVERLLEHYPDHDIYAEEGSRKEEGKSPYRWIIDPLDGTTNYAHQIPIFAVSLALEHRSSAHEAGEVVLGVVFAPALGELFHGYRGGGAWLNEERALKVSETRELINAVLATGFAYVRNETSNNNLDNWSALTAKTRGLRRLGSAEIDLCFVAAGRFDGFWEMHLEPYDVAAGALLISEAGGEVSDTEGGQDWLFGRRIVASNGHLHEAIKSSLAPLVPDGMIPGL